MNTIQLSTRRSKGRTYHVDLYLFAAAASTRLMTIIVAKIILTVLFATLFANSTDKRSNAPVANNRLFPKPMYSYFAYQVCNHTQTSLGHISVLLYYKACYHDAQETTLYYSAVLIPRLLLARLAQSTTLAWDMCIAQTKRKAY